MKAPYDILNSEERVAANLAAYEAYEAWDPQPNTTSFLELAYNMTTAAAQAVRVLREREDKA